MKDGVVADGIAKRFGHRWALRGVSFHVEPGAVVALMGANGSGKTTLLRTVATSLRPTRGSGTVFGHDLVTDAAAVRALVGVLYHAAGVYADLTARENLEFSRRMWRLESGPPVEEALERVGLGHAADQRTAGFSSGMTRRLALARLIMRPARLLLLDEPYASFDRDGIELVNQVVRDTVARDGIVLIATHDPERSAAVVDRVLHLERGRVTDAPEGGTAPSGPAEGETGLRIASGSQ